MTAPDPSRRRLQATLLSLPLWSLGSSLTWLAATPAHAHGNAAHGAATTRAPIYEQTPWGIGADPKKAPRTLSIRMDDQMRFTPDHLDVREGETLRLSIHNAGQVMHEWVLGTHEELMAHAELMKKHPGMEHDAPYMAHVAPSQRGELVWTFNRPGDFEFACLLPGHFDAGMRGTVRVLPA